MVSRNSTIPTKHDPYKRLVAAVVLQSIKDLQGDDSLAALDALCWFIDGETDFMLTVLDIAPKGDVLQMVVNNG